MDCGTINLYNLDCNLQVIFQSQLVAFGNGLMLNNIYRINLVRKFEIISLKNMDSDRILILDTFVFHL